MTSGKHLQNINMTRANIEIGAFEGAEKLAVAIVPQMRTIGEERLMDSSPELEQFYLNRYSNTQFLTEREKRDYQISLRSSIDSKSLPSSDEFFVL